MSVETVLDPPARRPAAVLMLVRPLGPDNTPHLVFIRRSQKVYQHKGQISFPGGGFQPADGQMETTALRETQEEIGLDPASLRVLGPLPPVDTLVTNFMVYPFVAVPRDPTVPISYLPDGFEVADILEMPLHHLISPAARRDEEWVIGGQPRRVVFYSWGHNVIWGATAYILTNFIHEIEAGRWEMLFGR